MIDLNSIYRYKVLAASETNLKYILNLSNYDAVTDTKEF